MLICATDTEIDWTAYMEQIEQYVAGERDYPMIKGGTGPLVYPAAHVYIYRGLYYITDEGKNILLAQRLFGLLYLCTLALVMACYKKAKVWPLEQSPVTLHWLTSSFLTLGTSVHIPNAHLIKTPPQYFRPPLLQRLLRRLLSLARHLHVPASNLDTGHSIVQLGSRH